MQCNLAITFSLSTLKEKYSRAINRESLMYWVRYSLTMIVGFFCGCLLSQRSQCIMKSIGRNWYTVTIRKSNLVSRGSFLLKILMNSFNKYCFPQLVNCIKWAIYRIRPWVASSCAFIWQGNTYVYLSSIIYCLSMRQVKQFNTIFYEKKYTRSRILNC